MASALGFRVCLRLYSRNIAHLFSTGFWSGESQEPLISHCARPRSVAPARGHPRVYHKFDAYVRRAHAVLPEDQGEHKKHRPRSTLK